MGGGERIVTEGSRRAIGSLSTRVGVDPRAVGKARPPSGFEGALERERSVEVLESDRVGTGIRSTAVRSTLSSGGEDEGKGVSFES